MPPRSPKLKIPKEKSVKPQRRSKSDGRNRPLPAWDTKLPTVELPLETQRLIALMPQLLLAPRDDKEAIKNLRILRRLVQSSPYVARVYSGPQAKRRGRPKGAGSLDPNLCYKIALAIDIYGYRPAEVLGVLDRLPEGDSSTADYHWLERRLEEGRRLLTLLPLDQRLLLSRAQASISKADRDLILSALFGKGQAK
jgi:hypothetical protein